MERAVALYPDSLNTRLKLSEFQLILKQYDAAYATLQDILEIRPGYPEALFMLGLTFRDQGKSEQAIGALQSAVERDPSLTEAWVILGDLLDRKKDPLAEQYFDNATRIDPKNVSAWHAKAYYLQNNDRIPEALEIYKHIHTLDSQYPEAYLNSTILYLYLDSLDAAEREVNILNGIDPSNAAGWFYKGRVLQSRGNPDGAKAAYEQALRLDPDYGQAQDALQELGAK
jgi:tetratricopeptide (TPR) repeat protein